MPVAHLGLTVSHIPSATSFYLSALQPLGYHYIGQRGDSIGLGLEDADFFLTQESRGARTTPCHVAFSASSRLSVRNCYAAAVNAGGRPSGAPSYRDGDCTHFNAAVEDLDGNTIEFVHRERVDFEEDDKDTVTASKGNQIQMWQKDLARHDPHGGVPSVSPRTPQSKARMQVALDLACQTSRSMRKGKGLPSGISRSRTAPVTSANEFMTKTLFGTILGAAAGAAIAFAMTKSEEDNARDETFFNASVRAQSRRSLDEPRSPKSHRRYSLNECDWSTRRPPPGRLAIEPAGYYDDGRTPQGISRPTPSHRPGSLQRSQKYDSIDYGSVSIRDHPTQHTVRRASTLPVNVPNHLAEAPRSNTSRRSSHHSHHDERKFERRDSVISTGSRRSRRTSDASKRSSNLPSRHPRRTSMHHESAAEVALPALTPASYISAARVPIPESGDGGWSDEDSDGLGDIKTVVPDDSISCVDLSKPKRKTATSKPSRDVSKQSEADSERTVTPAKGRRHSAMTMPVRIRNDYDSGNGGRRSLHSYA